MSGGLPSGASIRPDDTVRTFFRVLALAIGALWLIGALAIAIGGISDLARGDSKHGLPMLVGGIVLLVVVYGAWLYWQFARRPTPGLTLFLDPDHVVLSRRGRHLASIQRSEIGLVVLHASRGRGVDRLIVWGPDRQMLGEWETGWIKSATGPIRMLHRYQYPCVLNDRGARFGQAADRSQDVPVWADEVLGV